MQNFYELLGVRPDDDIEIIKKAFRKAAKASHPDHHGGDAEATARFRQISLAYEVLRDTGQRADYDLLLESELRPLRHRLRRSAAGMRRHVGDVAVAAVLAVVLTAGYKLYNRLPGLHSSSAATVTARQSPPVDAAERDSGERGVAPQMPLPVLPTPAAAAVPASAANSPDQVETTSREPSGPPEQPIAVAVRHDEPDAPTDAGVPRTTEDEPAVGHDAPSPASPSSGAEERNSTASDDSKTPEPGAANGGGVKPPETKTPMRATAAVKRHAPSRRPIIQQAALETPRKPSEGVAAAPEADAEPAPSHAPARILGVGF